MVTIFLINSRDFRNWKDFVTFNEFLAITRNHRNHLLGYISYPDLNSRVIIWLFVTSQYSMKWNSVDFKWFPKSPFPRLSAKLFQLVTPRIRYEATYSYRRDIAGGLSFRVNPMIRYSKRKTLLSVKISFCDASRCLHNGLIRLKPNIVSIVRQLDVDGVFFVRFLEPDRPGPGSALGLRDLGRVWTRSWE